MKNFMYFSIAVLCFAIAVLIGFHIGSITAEAQVSDPTAVQEYRVFYNSGNQSSYHYVMLPNGDLYYRKNQGGNPFLTELTFVGNFWEGSVATDNSNWGDIKSQFE